jgi:nucleotide-binding universal stress UspA family protein
MAGTDERTTSDGDLIVVGLDDTPGGRAALRFALLDAARRGGARVDAFTMFHLPKHTWGNGRVAAVDRSVAEIHDDVRARARTIVEDVRAGIGDDTAATLMVTVLAVGGNAGEALVHAARTADLLVVGSRGRGALTSAVLGSVSLHCVLHARCPVTVVHPAPDRHPTGTSR